MYPGWQRMDQVYKKKDFIENKHREMVNRRGLAHNGGMLQSLSNKTPGQISDGPPNDQITRGFGQKIYDIFHPNISNSGDKVVVIWSTTIIISYKVAPQ
jgi:hypothetical protein